MSVSFSCNNESKAEDEDGFEDDYDWGNEEDWREASQDDPSGHQRGSWHPARDEEDLSKDLRAITQIRNDSSSAQA